jgi:hypothetical protein
VWEDVSKSGVPDHPELLESFRRIVEERFKKLREESKSHSKSVVNLKSLV